MLEWSAVVAAMSMGAMLGAASMAMSPEPTSQGGDAAEVLRHQRDRFVEAVRGSPHAFAVIGPYAERCPVVAYSEEWRRLHSMKDLEEHIGESHWDVLGDRLTAAWKEVHELVSVHGLRQSCSRDVIDGEAIAWHAWPLGDGYWACLVWSIDDVEQAAIGRHIREQMAGIHG